MARVWIEDRERVRAFWREHPEAWKLSGRVGAIIPSLDTWLTM